MASASGGDPAWAQLHKVDGSSPTALRIALGTQLRQLRQASGISPEAAGEAIRASYAKISRIELGRVGLKQRDVIDLLRLYGVTDDREIEAFRKLARRSNTPGWWRQYGDLTPSWFELFLGLEQAATVIYSFEVQFVPGLLQTEDYARAVTLLGRLAGSAEEVDRRVYLRMTRQKLLTQPGAPKLWAVIDESALRRVLDSRFVMRAQLQHLIELCEVPNITLQLLPFSNGGHAAAGGPFTILRFAEIDVPDIVYLEQLTSSLYLDRRQDVESYLAVMDRLAVQAERPDRTPKLLRHIMKDQ